MAVHGKSLYKSGESAFKLILRNNLRHPVYDKTVEFVLIIGKQLNELVSIYNKNTVFQLFEVFNFKNVNQCFGD